MDKQTFLDKFTYAMGRFSSFKEIAAIRDGFIFTTPFTIAGSLFLLIAFLPIPGYSEFMAGIFGENWTTPLIQVAGGTFDILALIVAVAIAYKYTEAQDCDAISAATLSLCTFIVLVTPSVTLTSGEVVNGVIPKLWSGSNGVIASIIIALVVSKVFCYCEINKINIKLPEAVPGGVKKAFAAIVPGIIIFAIASIVYALCHYFANKSFLELIFSALQTPLQSLTDTLVGAVVIAAIQSIFFWAGIHGPNLVHGVLGGVLMANSIENQHLLESGASLLGNPDAHIMVYQISDVFIKSGGCGMTLGLLIAALIKSKSSQMKEITKLSIVPGIFNINEPVIFGLPIVFNPFLLIPFVLVPVCAMIFTYMSIYVGFMPALSAIQIPWTTPPILAGFLLNGWQGAVVQAVNIVISIVIYYPFVRFQDKQFLKDEIATNENK